MIVFQSLAKYPMWALSKYLVKKKNIQRKEKTLFFRDVVRAKWMMLKRSNIMVREFMAI